jgi:hypothetical protein
MRINPIGFLCVALSAILMSSSGLSPTGIVVAAAVMNFIRRVMKNKDLGAQALSILRLFGPKEMDLLYHEIVDFLYIWDCCDHTEKLMQDEMQSDLDELRLIRTAIFMSRISDLFSRKFDKICRKYPNFWQKCEKVAEELRIQVNGDKDNGTEKVLEVRTDKAIDGVYQKV